VYVSLYVRSHVLFTHMCWFASSRMLLCIVHTYDLVWNASVSYFLTLSPLQPLYKWQHRSAPLEMHPLIPTEHTHTLTHTHTHAHTHTLPTEHLSMFTRISLSLMQRQPQSSAQLLLLC
jgi:hypothetical protein